MNSPCRFAANFVSSRLLCRPQLDSLVHDIRLRPRNEAINPRGNRPGILSPDQDLPLVRAEGLVAVVLQTPYLAQEDPQATPDY